MCRSIFGLAIRIRFPIAERLLTTLAMLTAVGDPPKLVVAQGVGHMYRPQDTSALQGWLLDHVRHRPSHFSFVVDTPQHRGIWGISIPQCPCHSARTRRHDGQ